MVVRRKPSKEEFQWYLKQCPDDKLRKDASSRAYRHLVERLDDDGCFTVSDFRGAVWKTIKSYDHPEDLIESYLALFPSIYELVEGWNGWRDFTELVAHPAMWQQAEQGLQRAFRQDPDRIFTFTNSCIRNRIPVEVWQSIVDISVAQTEPLSAKEAEQAGLQSELWRAALSLD